jgi:signal transduction histidine kinase/ActR/RegA family two-component response regulator
LQISLSKKYTLIIVGLIGLVVALLIMATFYHSSKMATAITKSSSRLLKDKTLEETRNFAKSHIGLLADRLVNPLYYLNMDKTKGIIAESKNHKNIIYVLVFDTNCRVIHDGTDEILRFGKKIPQPKLCDMVSSNKESRSLMTENSFTVSKSIWIGDSHLGGVVISLSLTDIHKNLQIMQTAIKTITDSTLKEYLKNIGLITLGLVFLGLLLSFVVSKQFVKPIKEMVLYLRSVGKGEYDIELKRQSKDEIGEMYSSFRQMTGALKASTVSVVELKKEIQQRIKAESERNEMASQLQRFQKMEAVGRLASGVAHDLNNILSGIVSYPELLLLDLPEGSQQRKPLETIHKSGLKATAIVQDLLTLARRSVCNSEIVDFPALVKEYLCSPEYRKMLSFHPNVRVQTRVKPTFPNIQGTSSQLGKVVMNLVNNAAEAMPDGGTIFLKISNRYIDTPFAGYEKIEEGEYLSFSIQDTGIGIEKEDLEHIFEPFYTKKVMGRSGTGLGMAVVWGTVKDLNGYIDIESEIGKGTRIDLYFPISRKQVSKAQDELNIDELKGTGEAILVVDDVMEQREIATGILIRLGYRAEAVASGEEALDYIKTHKVDLILLDMIMAPGIDGCETYEKILATRPGQKALIASGFSESDQVKQALKMGAGCYIRKPYALEKLASAVQNELQSKRPIRIRDKQSVYFKQALKIKP